MFWRWFFQRCTCAALLLILLPALQNHAYAQSPRAPQQPAFTLRAESRVVLTDVTVTDNKGNPVHNLPQSAFHIFDNKQPQAIASFEEHTGSTAAVLPAALTGKGEYSNDYLLHLPAALNILILDISNISIEDQMYLYYQLNRFLKTLPEGQPLAIYLRSSSGCFLVQNFTSDRALLLTALRKAIPRLPPTGREYLSDYDTLRQIAGALGQLEGRKNILWFSGGSTLYLQADPGNPISDPSAFRDQAAWRNLYDDLEKERIAIYPIDARGLTVYGGHSLLGQHALMDEVAEATGGQAFYNTNGLTETSNRIVSTDGSFYTLTYSPHDLHFDNNWHHVRVTLDERNYHLSYRTGYFADGSQGAAQKTAEKRTRLLVDGQRLTDPDQRSLPIIFQARVLPASDPALAAEPAASLTAAPLPPRKGATTFSIRYTVPLDALTRQSIDGKHKIAFGVIAIALNRDGYPIAHRAERVSMAVNDDKLRDTPGTPVTVDQQLVLEKGDLSLSLGVWDMNSGRLGLLQIPLQVPKPVKH